jgi:hypothetical protein
MSTLGQKRTFAPQNICPKPDTGFDCTGKPTTVNRDALQLRNLLLCLFVQFAEWRAAAGQYG